MEELFRIWYFVREVFHSLRIQYSMLFDLLFPHNNKGELSHSDLSMINPTPFTPCLFIRPQPSEELRTRSSRTAAGYERLWAQRAPGRLGAAPAVRGEPEAGSAAGRGAPGGPELFSPLPPQVPAGQRLRHAAGAQGTWPSEVTQAHKQINKEVNK